MFEFRTLKINFKKEQTTMAFTYNKCKWPLKIQREISSFFPRSLFNDAFSIQTRQGRE
jgi:hypothetical protein